MSKPMQLFQQLSVQLLNLQRQRYTAIDYVMIHVPSSFSAVPEERNIIQRQLLGEPAMSLLEFEQNLERISKDPRPLGVILYMRGVAMSVADIQTVRDAILRLRDTGKRAIAYSARYSTADYYMASACDEILMLPGGVLETTGMFSQQVFLKGGLEAIGLEFDSVAISPYKGAADTFTRTEPSEEGREQTNWLLDSTFNMILDGIASTRKMKLEAVQQMINTSPHLSNDALDKGYIDGIMNEEDLIEYLGITQITPWEDANNQVFLPEYDLTQPYVAVIYGGGMIVDGESAKPPADTPVPIPFAGGERLGDITLNQQVRNLMKDPQCAALVLYIDSGGGSASASESMASTLEEFAKKRPLVVYMGGVAASGGYYIATPAHWIIAQSGTITGSIGVIMGKLVNSELLKKLKLNPVSYLRGDNAGIISSQEPFNDAQRDKIREGIEHVYEQFLARVARSRNMTNDEVDAVGGGRVWTGEQALEHGLVDEIGNLRTAVQKARSLAHLPDTAPAQLVRDKGKPIGAQLADKSPAAIAKYVVENVEYLTTRAQFIVPFDLKNK